jgi:hypothetical protein
LNAALGMTVDGKNKGQATHQKRTAGTIKASFEFCDTAPNLQSFPDSFQATVILRSRISHSEIVSLLVYSPVVPSPN